MIDDGGTAARHELLARIRDVLKAVRLFKNTLPPRRLSVPSGTPLRCIVTVAFVKSAPRRTNDQRGKTV